VTSDRRPTAAHVLILALLAVLCTGAAEIEGEAPPDDPARAADAPTAAVVRDPLYRLEFALPARFWRHVDNEELSAEARKTPGGCAPPPQVPDNLLFMFTHSDAPVLGRVELAERAFLLRNRTGLEEYVDARIEAIASQAGGAMQDRQVSYAEQPGAIVHRLDFTVPAAPGRGGCVPSGARPAMRYSIVHHFVRPAGADCLLFVLSCFGPADAFARLEPEVGLIVESFRYTGELQTEFFAPDAPEERLLTAADAAPARPGGFNWLMPVAVAMLVWMMLRRRKQKAAA